MTLFLQKIQFVKLKVEILWRTDGSNFIKPYFDDFDYVMVGTKMRYGYVLSRRTLGLAHSSDAPWCYIRNLGLIYLYRFSAFVFSM